MTEEQVSLPKVLPEVALIGMLLILSGSSGTIYSSGLFLFYFHPSPRFTVQGALLAREILLSLLMLASIVVGFGLLRVRPWARRWAVAVLLGLIVYWLLPLIPPFRTIESLQLLSRNYSILWQPLREAIMVLFLSTLNVRKEWGENGHPGYLTKLAERLLLWLPKVTPTLVLLIGLLCIHSAFRYLPGLSHIVRMAILGAPKLFLTQGMHLLFFVTFIATGIGLILYREWARYLAMAVLIGETIWRIILPVFAQRPLYLEAMKSVGIPGFFIPLAILGLLFAIFYNVVMIYFLWRSWKKPVSESEMNSNEN